MNQGEDVLERKVIHKDKVFIKAGDEHARAYLVQNGLLQGFIMDGDEKVVVAEFEPGRIIGETCLMVDEPMTMSYEAVVDTTVITITRQDFQKKISRMDKDVWTILEHVMNKLNYQDLSAVNNAMERAEIDPDAYKIVEAVTMGMDDQKKFQHEKVILPHANAMIKAIKELKEKNSKGDASANDAATDEGDTPEETAEAAEAGN